MQMNPAMLGQAANANPDAAAIRLLDAASAMLGEAVTLEVNGAAAGESTAQAEPTIEEYMAALLARTRNVRGSESVESIADSVEKARVTAARSAVQRREAVSGGAARSDVSASSSEPSMESADSPWKQSPPPECRNAISELRELANINARSSFNVHRGQQLVYEMHNKLTVSLVALVVSFALTTLAGSMCSPTYFAAVISLIVAMAWSVQYFQLGRQLAGLCLRSELDPE